MTKTKSFDTQALIQPKCHEDVAAIFDEIRAELKNLNTHLDAVISDCEKELQSA